MLRDHPKWQAAKGAMAGMLSHVIGPAAFEWILILCLSILPRGARTRVTDESRS